MVFLSQSNGLTFSYSLGLETHKLIGLTSADKSQDTVNSLHQALSNRISPASVLKLDIHLGIVPLNYSGPTPPKGTLVNYQEIDLLALGLNYIRAIMLKSDASFGYALTNRDDFTPNWFLARTAFIDFNQEYVIPNQNTSGLLEPKYRAPEIVRLENPLDISGKPINGLEGITIQMLAILG